MYRISISGKVVELTRHDILDIVAHQAEGYYFLAKVYIRCHVAGCPLGLADMPQGMHEIGNESLRQIEAQIEDDELREAYIDLRKALEELEEVDKQAIDWLATFVGLSTPQGNRDKRRLRKRLNRLTVTPEGQLQGPVWAAHPEYQAIVRKSVAMLVHVEQSKQRVDQRLQQLLAKCRDKPSEISEEVQEKATRLVRSSLPKSMQRLVRPPGWKPRGG